MEQLACDENEYGLKRMEHRCCYTESKTAADWSPMLMTKNPCGKIKKRYIYTDLSILLRYLTPKP